MIVVHRHLIYKVASTQDEIYLQIVCRTTAIKIIAPAIIYSPNLLTYQGFQGGTVNLLRTAQRPFWTQGAIYAGIKKRKISYTLPSPLSPYGKYRQLPV
jgi:hypothetical protein